MTGNQEKAGVCHFCGKRVRRSGLARHVEDAHVEETQRRLMREQRRLASLPKPPPIDQAALVAHAERQVIRAKHRLRGAIRRGYAQI